MHILMEDMVKAKKEINDEVQETREEEEHGRLGNSEKSNIFSIYELNMILVFLSIFCFQNEDLVDFEESEQITEEEVEAKTFISRIYTKRRDIHEPNKVIRKQTQRFRTTIKDCR